MEKINKKIRILFGFALGLSIGFPIGVLGIIFGAIYGIIPLLVIGIILAVAGFYVMPLLWVNFGEKREYRSVLYMIVHEGIRDVSALATHTNFDEKKIKTIINYLILSHCLTGFKYNNEKLEIKNTKDKPTKKCSSCGAFMTLNGDIFVCEFCGQSEQKH